mmetsp:Transcript_17681/g.33810  ORF Transcript_17681/g.33810 Transcript_17681/m.33810 type:complete len:284 (+) Transcript_17681:1386-2237(+)
MHRREILVVAFVQGLAQAVGALLHRHSLAQDLLRFVDLAVLFLRKLVAHERGDALVHNLQLGPVYASSAAHLHLQRAASCHERAHVCLLLVHAFQVLVGNLHGVVLGVDPRGVRLQHHLLHRGQVVGGGGRLQLVLGVRHALVVLGLRFQRREVVARVRRQGHARLRHLSQHPVNLLPAARRHRSLVLRLELRLLFEPVQNGLGLLHLRRLLHVRLRRHRHRRLQGVDGARGDGLGELVADVQLLLHLLQELLRRLQRGARVLHLLRVRHGRLELGHVFGLHG